MEGGSLGVWVGEVMYAICRMFAFFGLSQYFDQGSSAFFSCALNVNVIGLLFLRQCLVGLPPSTETSISGMSRKLPLFKVVSQYVWVDGLMYVICRMFAFFGLSQYFLIRALPPSFLAH
jgi:hypothetical protein